MTPIARRNFMGLTGAFAAAAPMRASFAAEYPAFPVHWVVATGAGGTADLAARIVARKLSEVLGQPVIIDNKLGGGGEVAVETVFNAPADGLLILNVTSVNAVNQSLYDNLKVDFLRDIAPVAGIVRIPLIMLVNPDVPAKTAPEFIAYVKANPGKVNFASVGNGTPPHLAGELFKTLAGVDMVHVPYRVPPQALQDLIAGRMQLMFTSIPVGDYVKEGKLRAIASTGEARAPDFPDLPTVATFLPGFEASSWFGIGVKRGAPDNIVERLETAMRLSLADPDVVAGLTRLGGNLMPLSASAFGTLVADETAKWRKVIRAAHIKPD